MWLMSVMCCTGQGVPLEELLQQLSLLESKGGGEAAGKGAEGDEGGDEAGEGDEVSRQASSW